MSDLIFPRCCEGLDVRATPVQLYGAHADGLGTISTRQKGKITLDGTKKGVVSIVPICALMQIISSTIPVVRLRLWVDNEDLNKVYSPVGPSFCLELQITTDHMSQQYASWQFNSELSYIFWDKKG